MVVGARTARHQNSRRGLVFAAHASIRGFRSESRFASLGQGFARRVSAIPQTKHSTLHRRPGISLRFSPGHTLAAVDPGLANLPLQAVAQQRDDFVLLLDQTGPRVRDDVATRG